MSDLSKTPFTQGTTNITELCPISIWAISNHLSLAQLSQYSNSLWAGWSGDQIPVRVKFSAPIQTSPGSHPASYTIDTRSFPRVK